MLTELEARSDGRSQFRIVSGDLSVSELIGRSIIIHKGSQPGSDTRYGLSHLLSLICSKIPAFYWSLINEGINLSTVAFLISKWYMFPQHIYLNLLSMKWIILHK